MSLSRLVLEDGGFLLLEDGGHLLLEDSFSIPSLDGRVGLKQYFSGLNGLSPLLEGRVGLDEHTTGGSGLNG